MDKETFNNLIARPHVQRKVKAHWRTGCFAGITFPPDSSTRLLRDLVTIYCVKCDCAICVVPLFSPIIYEKWETGHG